MALAVHSEIGRLRRVLIHSPGPEIDQMVPDMMEHLLFDDILYGEAARREHAALRTVLERADVEVLEAQELLTEVLASGELRRDTVDRLERRYSLSRERTHGLREMSPPELALVLVAGLRVEDTREERKRHYFDLAPVPNYFFQRDPQFVVGDRVVISSMATEAREREPMLGRLIFQHHPALAGATPFLLPRPEFGGPDHDPETVLTTVEGGDVLVASEDVLLVGLSERTNRRGVEHLANFLRAQTPYRHLIQIELPQKRSFMHLDTVLTFIDRGVCLAHLPVVEPSRVHSGHAYLVDLQGDRLTFKLCASVPAALEEVGLSVEVVPCGGAEDRIDQEREQWTDGANAFAVAPGVILLYQRNLKTTGELSRRGWRVLREEQVLAGEPVLGRGPTVVTFLGHELSRARGGPRCMTMPLEREPI